MKIARLHLKSLRNEEHFQFMTDTKGLVEQTGAETLNIASLYPSFLNLYDREDIALEVIRKSPLTDLIAGADAVRENPYRGLVLLTEAYEHSSDEAEVQAAQNIRVVIDHYGDFRSKPYNEETATIYNFLQDINSRCAADIAVLNAQSWLDELASSNQAFDDLMNQRFDDAAGREIISLYETRKEIDLVYTEITERINASILLNGEAAYADFVNKLNERIVYFKHTLSVRKRHSRKATQGETES
jgi:hypothetical protein